MTAAPKRPELSEAAKLALNDVPPGEVIWPHIEDWVASDHPLATDARALLEWRTQREDWAKAQPIDEAQSMARWRMYGGPWVPAYLALTDGNDLSMYAMEVAKRQLLTGPKAFRAWASRFYEWRAMEARLMEPSA